MKDRSVSVVIPARGRPDLLRRALESVLSQTTQPHEIIVVDDGSPSALSESLAGRFTREVRFLRHSPGVNAAFARNQGIDAADGQYVAFLDSDDWWEPEHLELCTELLERHPWIGLFGAYRAVAFAGGAAQRRPRRDPDPLESIKQYLFLSGGSTRTSTMVFRRAAAASIRFDDQLEKHQDWDFAIRAQDHGMVGYNNAPTTNIDHAATGRMTGQSRVESTHYLYEKYRHKFTRTERIALLIRVARHALEHGNSLAARQILNFIEDELTASEFMRVTILHILSAHPYLSMLPIISYRLARKYVFLFKYTILRKVI